MTTALPATPAKVDDVAWVRPLPARGAPPLRTPHAALHVADARDPLPPGTELALRLPSLDVAAYVPEAPSATAAVELTADPLLRGHAFRPLHESPGTLAALVSIAAARRMESGPESERLFVIVRGQGLVFLQNEDTMRFGTLDAIHLPAGEPARLWSQGPDDVLAFVVQPRTSAPRGPRTLGSELRRLREEAEGADTRDPSSS